MKMKSNLSLSRSAAAFALAVVVGFASFDVDAANKSKTSKPSANNDVDVAAVFQALADVGYTGVCHIDCDVESEKDLQKLATTVGYCKGVMAVIKPKAIMDPVPKGANTLSAKEKAEGYELLFDGENLPVDMWVGVKEKCKRFPRKGWYVSGGALTMRPTSAISNGKWIDLPPEDKKLGGGGDIVTKKKFKDFVFKFDFRMTEAANSGVKYFYDERQNKSSSEEYQILDKGHPLCEKNDTAIQQIGALYDLFPANGANEVVKPTGKWNSGMIVSKGNKVEHWLNGVKVLEYERGGESFRKAVSLSKYKTWGRTAKGKSQSWGELVEGRLLLQDHGDSTVSFCNLKVKELK